MFGGVSNLLPISADYSLKSQIGIGKNWVGPPPILNYHVRRTVFLFFFFFFLFLSVQTSDDINRSTKMSTQQILKLCITSLSGLFQLPLSYYTVHSTCRSHSLYHFYNYRVFPFSSMIAQLASPRALLYEEIVDVRTM